MKTRFATSTCVDCGSHKDVGAHPLAQRCKPCAENFYRQVLAANRALNAAVRRGDIPAAKTQRCADCDSTARDWDHRDYSKPLQVQAVCRACNFKRGPAKYTLLAAA